MKVGTKSVLYGAHCFFLHPVFVALAWIKLYGFPFDPRIWVAFLVHDLGYWGKPNMDGPEGENHVLLGARIMHALFDWEREYHSEFAVTTKRHAQLLAEGWKPTRVFTMPWGPNGYRRFKRTWYNFSLYHSRYYAKKHNAAPSKLCFADKLSFVVTPRWLYLPMVTATGEINEYLRNANTHEKNWNPVTGKKKWHSQLKTYIQKWVDEHVTGKPDDWTSTNRHPITATGVTA